MANILTNAFFNDILDTYRNLGVSGKLKVALLTDTATSHLGSGVTSYGELQAYEVVEGSPTGQGYTTGGKILTNVNISGQTKLIADNVQWPASTITARWAILYDDTNALASNKRLIAVYDFASNQSSISSIFEIAWGVNGVINLTQG